LFADIPRDDFAVPALASAPLQEAALSIGEAADESAWPSDLTGVSEPDGLVALDRTLAALCRQRAPLRAVLARIASRLVRSEAWDPLGYARLSDYSAERLGLSARWVRSLALVGRAFHDYPRLEEALASGALGWTKVRLLASLPPGEDEAAWLARASQVTAAELAKLVRKVDRGSLEGGVLEDEAPVSRLFEVRCTPEVRWKFNAGRHAARRVAGRMCSMGEAAEVIAAEVLSAIPTDQIWERETRAEEDASWRGPSEWARKKAASEAAACPPWQGYGALEPLVAGLEEADAFELDRRFRRALAIEQRLDAQMGPILARVWNRWIPRLLGYPTREAYARERLGMDPTRARALVRLERAAVASEPLARAYRTAALSWVKAEVLVPMVSADPLGRFMAEWVGWAGQVTVRRLREDVEWALTLADADPEAFRLSGGLPSADREIGAQHRDRAKDTSGRSDPAVETCTACFIGPADVVQLFRAVLCTVRRRIEKETGRMPTEGQALGAMLDYVFECWGIGKGKTDPRDRVFERDGWLCTVPGCTSMRNLHSHHIIFRSAGGAHGPANRTSLCAFHHLRGVHAGRLRCTGRAPDGLTWQIGIRPGRAPLATYTSGDREVRR
jgi:hypothetical protein